MLATPNNINSIYLIIFELYLKSPGKSFVIEVIYSVIQCVLDSSRHLQDNLFSKLLLRKRELFCLTKQPSNEPFCWILSDGRPKL